jgi:hypothetical protein
MFDMYGYGDAHNRELGGCVRESDVFCRKVEGHQLVLSNGRIGLEVLSLTGDRSGMVRPPP